MARGSASQLASSSSSPPANAAPRGSAPAAAGMRRRRLGGAGGFSSSRVLCGSGSGMNMLRFYTDDAPGMKISPPMVIFSSVCFIGCVTDLHVFGKFYRQRSACEA